MKTLIKNALLPMLTCVSVSSVASNANSGVGINLTGLNYWSSQWTTIDVMKHASNGSGQLWATSNARTYEYNTGDQLLLDLDEQGWPRSLPPMTDDSPFHYVTTIIFHDNPHYAQGEYVVLYEGEGELRYSGPELVSSSPGRDVVRMTEDSYFHLQIHSTDPNNLGDHIRNIRIIAPGGSCSTALTDYALSAQDCDSPNMFIPFEQSYMQRVFHPLFLQDMSQFRTLRFMQLLNTIDNPIENWSARPKYDYASWGLKGGTPLEVAILMSNKLKAEGWYNLPARVNDDYIQQFARLLKLTTDNQSDVYIELGNEIWNNAWPYINDALYMQEQGKKMWPNTHHHDIEYRMNYYGMRSAQMCDIVKQEFAEQASRVKCVMGGQAGVPWINQQALSCPIYASGTNQQCAQNMDILAVGSYFAGYYANERYLDILTSWAADPVTGVDNLFTELYSDLLRSLTYNADEPAWWQAPANGALAQAKENISGNLQLAQQYNLMLAAYEGGQHLTYAGDSREGREAINESLFLAANRDARMATAFIDHLSDWRDSGAGLFMVFESTGRWDRWGAFPLKEYQAQTREDAVKFDAVLSFVEQNPCWWANCERTISPVDEPIVLPPSDPVTPPPIVEPEPEPEPTPVPTIEVISSPLFDTNGVMLNWQLNDSLNSVVFKIYRNEQLIFHTTDEQFKDHWQPLNVDLKYRVDAVEKMSNSVVASQTIVTKAGDSEPPRAPELLTIESNGQYGVKLHWQMSEDNNGIKLYKIIRNGQMYTHTSDNYFEDPWPPQGTVSYALYAQDFAGNLSDLSQSVSIQISYK
ncbi:hypothetical protein [Pseudoalteromonas sp. A25]|uniref:hypothetical protein n=1 Tax=Pseudoalteromonas sp. A25 TaxID=116092 RepID=UPI001260C314|nr:hypothetical protein [Pseudoalteromonas sp. A25]